jgi:hypothetical protein
LEWQAARLIMSARAQKESPMAEEPATKPDDAEKQIERLTKQTALLEAQKKLAQAQNSLSDLRKPPDPSAASLAPLKAAKDLADAQKAIADAQKARSDADLAAFKASIGEVPATGRSGSVDVQGYSGELEATLLAMKAVEEAALVVADRVRNALQENARVAVMNATELPTFNSLIAYNTEVAVVRQIMTMAISAARLGEPAASEKPAAAEKPVAESVPMLAAAGVALDATSKLLSFFQSDVSLKGVALTLEDSVAMNAVAGALTRSEGGGAKKLAVLLPAVYRPAQLSGGAAFYIDHSVELTLLRGEAQTLLKALEQRTAELGQSGAAETDAEKLVRQEALASAGKVVSGLQSAITLMEAWHTKLAAADSKGLAAVVNVANERAIAEQILDGHLLVVKLQKAGGGLMTKKNLWTVLGGMPLFHMGGAALSFTLIDGRSGIVQAAGVVPIHGGFVKAGHLRTALANRTTSTQGMAV